jgi:hypothetical protein
MISAPDGNETAGDITQHKPEIGLGGGPGNVLLWRIARTAKNRPLQIPYELREFREFAHLYLKQARLWFFIALSF